MAKNHVWHGFRLIFYLKYISNKYIPSRGFDRFLVPKVWEKTSYMDVLPQKQKISMLNMAKYGQ